MCEERVDGVLALLDNCSVVGLLARSMQKMGLSSSECLEIALYLCDELLYTYLGLLLTNIRIAGNSCAVLLAGLAQVCYRSCYYNRSKCKTLLLKEC